MVSVLDSGSSSLAEGGLLPYMGYIVTGVCAAQ